MSTLLGVHDDPLGHASGLSARLARAVIRFLSSVIWVGVGAGPVVAACAYEDGPAALNDVLVVLLDPWSMPLVLYVAD